MRGGLKINLLDCGQGFLGIAILKIFIGLLKLLIQGIGDDHLTEISLFLVMSFFLFDAEQIIKMRGIK